LHQAVAEDHLLDCGDGCQCRSEALSEEFPLRLTTGRRLDSFNTGVQTGGYTSPLRRGEELELSAADAESLGVTDGGMTMADDDDPTYREVSPIDAKGRVPVAGADGWRYEPFEPTRPTVGTGSRSFAMRTGRRSPSSCPTSSSRATSSARSRSSSFAPATAGASSRGSAASNSERRPPVGAHARPLALSISYAAVISPMWL
jgi:hypothetical protein